MTHDVGDILTRGITFTDTDGNPVDPTTVTVTVRAPDLTESVLVYGVDTQPTKTSTGVYSVDIDATLPGTWALRWVAAGAHQAAETDSVYVSPAWDVEAAFATADDLAARLGQTFTVPQAAHAATLLRLATDLILDAISKDQAWLSTQTSIPGRLKVTCIEVAVRGYSNPSGVRSQSETLGAHTFSQSWADQATGLELTEREDLACRRAVYGTLAGSARAATLIDHISQDVETGAIEFEDEISS